MTETDIPWKEDGTPLVEGHHVNCCCPDCDEVHWNKFIDEARHGGYTAGRRSMQEDAAKVADSVGEKHGTWWLIAPAIRRLMP